MRAFSYLVFACLFLTAFPARAEFRCVDIFIAPPPVFHNEDVKSYFKDGVTLESLARAAPAMLDKGLFDIPVQENGFIAAANVGDHAGNYGKFLWLRDFARVYSGLSTLPKLLKGIPGVTGRPHIQVREAIAQQVAKAQMELLANQQWTEMAVKNIVDPTLHMDGKVGHRSVIWVRRLLEPFVRGREPTPRELETDSSWGHKQNDALAVFAHSFLDSLKTGRLRASEISEPAKINLTLLAAYFVRLKYWRMWDVGAWEEGMGLRTSSIALVTSFLERFHEGFNEMGPLHPRNEEERFFRDLRENILPLIEQIFPREAAALTEDALLPSSLVKALEEAYAVIQERLPMDPRSSLVESVSPEETRFEDTALLHAFWYPLKKLGAWHHRRVAEKLAVFERPSGYVRYVGDWFLYGSAMASSHTLPLGGPMAVREPLNGGWLPATENDRRHISAAHGVKDMGRVIEVGGPGLEAQWTLPDAYLAQAYAEMYLRGNDKDALVKAKYHFHRLVGLITGETSVNSEGKPVDSWRLPEAYSPVRVLVSEQPEVRYFASPNSPLNWATAEFILAYERLWAALLKESNNAGK